MDYRVIENRLERNRELVKERSNSRLLKEAKKANMANRKQRPSLFAMLHSLFSSLRRSKPKIEVQSEAPNQPLPQRQVKQH